MISSTNKDDLPRKSIMSLTNAELESLYASTTPEGPEGIRRFIYETFSAVSHSAGVGEELLGERDAGRRAAYLKSQEIRALAAKVLKIQLV